MSGAGEAGVVRAVLPCDGAPVPPAWREAGWPVVPIRSRGEGRALNLRVDGLGAKITGRLDRRANDLVRIAAYAFAADQLLSRGGKGDPHRRRWRREPALGVPVADPGFWGASETTAALVEALGFGTDDRWAFAFAPAEPEGGQLQLDIHFDDRERLADPDCVALLSGGTDSLCAAVEAVAAHRRRPLLVSHRTGPHVAGPQRALVKGLKDTLPQWAFPEISFWVHQRGEEAVERTRRTRGFLVAAVGAAVAGQVGLSTVLVPDNGYVSVNPPVNAQLVGALNSRGTHPTFLRLMNRLLALVFPAGVRVENPLADRTRAEALGILAAHGAAGLLPATRSCARSRRPADKPHCGTCSQCVDRRVAAVAAGLEDHDPADRYAVDLFTAPLPPGEARVFAVSYAGFAQRVDARGSEDLFLDHPELEACLDLDGEGVARSAARLADLLKRHSDEVLRAIETMVERHSRDLTRHRLPPGCLLKLATGPGFPDLAPDEAAPDEVDALDPDAPAPGGPEPTEELGEAPARGGQAQPAERPRLERHGRAWFVAFGGEKGLVDHSVGMTRLARLLKAPGQELLALDLVAWSGPGKGDRRAGDGEPVSGSGELRGSGRLGARTDAEARRNYEAWAEALRERRADAEAAGDAVGVAEADAEMDALASEVVASAGKGGKVRTVPDEHEQARQAVSHSLRKALVAVAGDLPGLRAHLDESLHLGLRCAYEPRPRQTWDVTL